MNKKEIKRIHDEQAVLAQNLDDARDEGIQISQEKVRLEGILRGEEKSRAEGEQQSKIAVAKNSLEAGASKNVTVQITGLSPDDIQKLRNSHSALIF